MGFNTSATTTTLTAKLTPIGRQLLVSNNNSLITAFGLGDSDANYRVSLPLESGEIPSDGGNVGPNFSVSNSTGPNPQIKSVLLVNGSGVLLKAVESQSINISSETLANGQVIVSGSSLSHNLINRNNNTTDSLVNLYYSFGLPLDSSDDYNYTGVTSVNGGFSDTAVSGIAQSNILVIGIDNTTYGELIDGKTIKLELSTTAGTFTIYSTFENKNTSLAVQDVNIVETSISTASISNNIAFLFSDDIMTPNGGDPAYSWATGYNTIKPFSVNQKKLFNLTTNSNLAQTADTAVGIAYLDKGFLVITHPTIVNAFDMSGSSATTVTLDSVSTAVFQNITCIANRGEFGGSTNPTFGPTDVARISEVALYDNQGNLIALAKPDRHILKNVNQFLALGIRISL